MKTFNIAKSDITLYGKRIPKGHAYGKFENIVYFLEDPSTVGGVFTCYICKDAVKGKWIRMDLGGKYARLQNHLEHCVKKFWSRLIWHGTRTQFKAERDKKAIQHKLNTGARIGAPSSETTRDLDDVFRGSPKSAALSTGRYDPDGDFFEKLPNVIAGTGIHVKGKKFANNEEALHSETARFMEAVFPPERTYPGYVPKKNIQDWREDR